MNCALITSYTYCIISHTCEYFSKWCHHVPSRRMRRFRSTDRRSRPFRRGRLFGSNCTPKGSVEEEIYERTCLRVVTQCPSFRVILCFIHETVTYVQFRNNSFWLPSSYISAQTVSRPPRRQSLSCRKKFHEFFRELC